ncbi:hypothetical protein [Novosphingobium sp.]|uniref:hypothetical protein n=1 Tax=Novosphingobium sp. TaxID=1874826 RepID=UPI003D135F12
MTKRVLTALLLAATTLPLAACVDGPGPGYASTPYAYDGYYDGYYGDVYDGYWGDDGGFYYRHGANERRYIRGDNAHFSRETPNGNGNFHAMHGSMTPGRGMNMPHFSGGGGHGFGGHGGGHGGGDHH